MDSITEITISCQGATSVSLDELQDLQGNLKDLTEDNYAKLRNSLIEFGFSFPIFFWQDENGAKWIIDAHQRKRTLLKMRDEGILIPSLPADPIFAKDRAEAKKKLLLLNSRYGQMTQEGFDEFTSDIEIEDIADLLTIPEVMFIEDGSSSDVAEDEVPPVSQDPAKSELGKVYQLGRHRLMCGDATKIEDVEKLMNGKKADMVFTDPPYGYSYESNHQDKHDVLLNDDKILDFFPLAIAFTNDNAPIYTFCGFQTVDKWIKIIKDNGLSLKNMIVWKKNNWSMGDLEGAYAGQYELILYTPKGRTLIQGKRDTDVWEYNREAPTDHPTMKPVGLISIAIQNHKADSVLDFFGGSGSTLIACEQTNRTCCIMELDPKYCDVIRRRYWKFVNDNNEEGWEENTPSI